MRQGWIERARAEPAAAAAIAAFVLSLATLAGYNVLISLALAVIAGFGLASAWLTHGVASRAAAS